MLKKKRRWEVVFDKGSQLFSILEILQQKGPAFTKPLLDFFFFCPQLQWLYIFKVPNVEKIASKSVIFFAECRNTREWDEWVAFVLKWLFFLFLLLFFSESGESIVRSEFKSAIFFPFFAVPRGEPLARKLLICQWKGLSKLADSCSSLQGFISVSFSGWYTDAVILLDNEAIYVKCKKYFHLPKLLPNLLILILSFNGNPSLNCSRCVLFSEQVV